MEPKIEQEGDENLNICGNGSLTDQRGAGMKPLFLHVILMDSV